MLPAVRSRFAAFGLTRDLRRSLEEPKDRWKMDSDEGGNTVLTKGEFRIVLVARALRLLDTVHLYREDAEIWLPLLSRLRLRSSARLRLIRFAKQETPKPAKSSGTAQASRRTRRAGAA
jgi:hypothetical protein